MVIISTSATEVSIHAVSPVSIFGAAGAAASAGVAAGAAAAEASAGAAGAGACAAAESVSSSVTDMASIRRCKTRFTECINFLQETDRRRGVPSPGHEPDALPVTAEYCRRQP